MEAIVLAGGLGTRLRAIVPDLPKPMAPVAGRPFLEILLTALAGKGFRRVVLSLCYMSEKVIAHFGNHFAGMELIYEIEQTPLGTGGAVRQAMMRCGSDHTFVFNGDTFLDLEVEAVEAQWKIHREPIVVARQVHDTARYGRIESTNGRIVSFLEKGFAGPGIINAGCYVLPIDILNDSALGRAFSLESDFLAKAVTRQRFGVFVTNGHFIDIGVPEDYSRAQVELAGVCK